MKHNLVAYCYIKTHKRTIIGLTLAGQSERGRSRREERDIRDEQRRRGTEKTASALFSG